jgi:hypothetical protein
MSLSTDHDRRNAMLGACPFMIAHETTKERLDYLQSLHVALGLQKAVLPIESIADLSLARDATRMI